MSAIRALISYGCACGAEKCGHVREARLQLDALEAELEKCKHDRDFDSKFVVRGEYAKERIAALEAEHAEWRQRAIERLDQLSERADGVWLSRDEAEWMRDELARVKISARVARKKAVALLDERMKP